MSEAQNRLNVLWGARAIGEFIGLEQRQAYYLLETGRLPGRKVGDRWTSTPEALRQCILGEEAA